MESRYTEFKRRTCRTDEAENVSLISNPARKVGGVHVYVNTTGVGVEARMMFDGSAMIVANGKVLEQGAQLSLKDVVELTTATFDIEGVRVFRFSISRNVGFLFLLFSCCLIHPWTTYFNVPILWGQCQFD
jgi:hypothetical protein